MAVNKDIKVFDVLKKFRSRIETFKDETRRSYRKVYLSFKNYVFFRYLSDCAFCESLVCEWYVFLRFKGSNRSKAYYYVDKLGNLYSGVLKGENGFDPLLFKNLRKKIKECDSFEGELPFTLKQMPSFTASILQDYSQEGSHDLGRDLLLFSLCNGGMPVGRLVSLRKEETDSCEPHSRHIAEKYVGTRRKYLFPLDQAQLTPRRSALMACELIEDTLKHYGFDVPPSSVSGITKKPKYPKNLKNPDNPKDLDDCLSLLWVCLAIYYGISPSCLPLSDFRLFHSHLADEPGEEFNKENIKDLYSRVAAYLFAGHKKWFALRLRPYVRFDQLEDRLAAATILKHLPEFYYPCEEIARRVGRSLVWKEKPFIRDIVFFKTRPSDVYPLCREIRDLAWCYRDTRFGSYAEIPEREIETFQRTIGIFTSEFEVAPAGEMAMRPGDRVVVVGGDYINKTGTILNLENRDNLDGHTIYRIQLFDTNLKWSVGLDARFLRPQ